MFVSFNDHACPYCFSMLEDISYTNQKEETKKVCSNCNKVFDVYIEEERKKSYYYEEGVHVK